MKYYGNGGVQSDLPPTTAITGGLEKWQLDPLFTPLAHDTTQCVIQLTEGRKLEYYILVRVGKRSETRQLVVIKRFQPAEPHPENIRVIEKFVHKRLAYHCSCRSDGDVTLDCVINDNYAHHHYISKVNADGIVYESQAVLPLFISCSLFSVQKHYIFYPQVIICSISCFASELIGDLRQTFSNTRFICVLLPDCTYSLCIKSSIASIALVQEAL